MWTGRKWGHALLALVLMAALLLPPTGGRGGVAYAAGEYIWDTDGELGQLTTINIAGRTIAGGVLSGVSTNFDSQIWSPANLTASADELTKVTVRMSIEPGDHTAQLFWAADNDPMAEKMSLRFSPIADGQMHDYVFYMKGNAFWHGVITRIRIDPTNKANTAFSLDSLKVEAAGADVEAVLGRSSLMTAPGEPFQIYLQLENRGDVPAVIPAAELTLPPGLMLAGSTPAWQQTSDLAPLERRTIVWTVTGSVYGDYTASAALSGPNIESRQLAMDFTLAEDDSAPAYRSPVAPAVYETAGGSAVLENEGQRIVFVKNDSGYIGYKVQVWGGTGWYSLASTQPFSTLVYELDGRQEQRLVPDSYAVLAQDSQQAEVQFSGSFTDSGNAVWSYSMRFHMTKDGSATEVSYNLSPSENRGIYRFEGPILRAGDGSFGTDKDEAIFSGLEWLEGDEESSASGPDFQNHHANRTVPLYYKITAPVMSVAKDQYAVSLNWNPLQQWHGAQQLPSAQFSAPNRLEAMDNQQMGLFVPSTASGHVKENNTEAGIVYAVPQDTSIQLDAQIHATADAALGAADALARYYEEEQPAPASAIRSNAESAAISATALTDTLWDDSKKGWTFYLNTAYNPRYDVYPYPERITALLRYALYTSDGAQGALAKSRALEALAALEDRYGSAAYGMELPYYAGGAGEALLEQEYQVEQLIATQKEDGNWPYTGDIVYGEPGSSGMGVTARAASQILTFGKYTGSRNAIESGLKGLEALNGFLVPRGAQSWEASLHAPDILAAARAIDANMSAYDITGEEPYKQHAAAWGIKGLPFLYAWQAEDKNSAMKFSSIPLFAASWYWRSWLGEPVPWNGLDYADGLRRLAEADDSLPWDQIAEGIWRSTARMINLDERGYGTYPDIYFLSNDVWGAPWLNPGKTLNAAWLSDQFPYAKVNSKVLELSGQRFHVSSAAQLSAAGMTTSVLTATLAYPDGETSYTTISGLLRPDTVKKDGTVLPYAADLANVAEGWSYSPNISGLVMVKLAHGQTPAQLAVEQPAPAASWSFSDDAEGWTAAGSGTSITVEDGALLVAAVADGPAVTRAVSFEAADYAGLSLRQQAQRGHGKLVKLLWRGAGQSWSQDRSIQGRLKDDGAFSTVVLEVGKLPEWSGTIAELRLEWPDTQAGQAVAIGHAALVADVVEKADEWEWDFNEDGSFEGWSPVHGIAGAAVANGSLSGLSTNDPYLYSPNLYSTAVPVFQMRMKTTAGGASDIFYTLPQPYHTYTTERRTSLPIPGTGRFYDYTAHMSALTGNPNRWEMDLMKQIRSLRIDPLSAAGAQFEIDYIGLLKDPDQQAYHKLWTFDQSVEGWTSGGGFSAPVRADDGSSSVLRAVASGDEPVLLGPTEDINTKYKYVMLRLKSSGADKLRLKWSYGNGIYTAGRVQELDLVPDGQYHVYVIKASHATTEWRGIVKQLALSFPGAPNAGTIDIDYIKLAEFPEAEKEWAWSLEQDAEGWTGSAALDTLEVAEGILSAAVVNAAAGAAYVQSPAVSVPAAAYPVLRIRTAVEAGDTAELYWTTDGDSQWDEAKRLRFPVVPDGKLRTYEIYLADHALWQDNIRQLRLQFGDGSQDSSVRLDYLRLIADKGKPLPLLWDFTVNGAAKGWSQPGKHQHLQQPSYGADGLTWTLTGNDPYFIGPAIVARAQDYAAAQITLTVPAGNGNTAKLYWKRSGGTWNNADSVSFDIVPDGAPHEYMVHLAGLDGWNGDVVQLRLDPINSGVVPAGTVTIRDIALLNES